MMFTPGDEFVDVLDGLEPIVLRTRDEAHEFLIRHAKRSAVDFSEAAKSNGVYRRGDVRWHFASKDLEIRPEIGGQIEDASGQVWTILEASLAVANARWKCRTRDLIVSEGLHELITIQFSDSSSPLASGEREDRWADLRVGVPARIQPLTWEPKTIAAQRREVSTHEIYFASQIELTPLRRYRMVDARGRVFMVEKIEQSERIDVLPKAIAEIRE